MIDGIEMAKLFHDTYERLAPSFGYQTRPDTKAFNPLSPNGKLMTAVCKEVCEQIQKVAFDSGFVAGLRERNA